MEKEEIQKLNDKQLVEFIDEQKELPNGLTITKVAEILRIKRTTLNSRIKKIRESGGKMDDSKNSKEQMSTPIQAKEKISISKRPNVNTGQTKNVNFTQGEIEVLKNIIDERKNDLKLFHEYRIYKELDKVPINEETVRSAFNMSKTTTERLKRYASVSRLPLQDLVELAVINLLDQYDKN